MISNIYFHLFNSSLIYIILAIIGWLVFIVLFIVKTCKSLDKDDSKSTYNYSNNNYNNTYRDKGTIGEEEIDRELQHLDRTNYVVLRNLVLLNNNSTHQIDHVVVSNYGIFIIETKNYTGFVKGSDKYHKWVQFIGKKKYFFLNPVIQNKGHIKALEAFFPDYSPFFVPIVCFTNKTRLAVRSNNIVINSSQLLRVIHNYKTEVLIPDIHEVAQNLKNISLDRMDGINQDHLNNVRKYKN